MPYVLLRQCVPSIYLRDPYWKTEYYISTNCNLFSLNRHDSKHNKSKYTQHATKCFCSAKNRKKIKQIYISQNSQRTDKQQFTYHAKALNSN